MAGSRREKLGSVLTRMTGLLRSGAVKEEDRPIWYDVVKALPPKPVPSAKDIPNILYPEDFIRVHYYRTFYEPALTVLTNERMKSVPQRFVDKYLEIQSQRAVPTNQLFDETVRILKEEKVRFLTHQEKEEQDRARRESLELRKKESLQEHQQREDIIVDYDSASLEEIMADDSSRISSGKQSKHQIQANLDDLFK